MVIRCNRIFWLRALTFFLTVSIVFRCSPELFYQKGLIEYAVILGLSILSFHGYKQAGLMIFELLILLFPLFFVTGGRITKYVIFTLIGIYYYFRIQKDCEAFYAIRLPIVLFGVFTALVTWFSFFFPSIYIRKFLPLLPESDALASSFQHRNMYMGFTTHYSRNAFYILIAIQLLFAEVYCRKKGWKGLRIWLLIFLSLTELLVAKRGPLLFLILSILILIILKEPDLAGKLKKLWVYAAGIIVMGILAVLFIPGANNIVIRMIDSIRTGDITTGRFALYRIGINMFLEHPLFGCGWDSFRRIMQGTSDQGVHNDYIQLLGEVGIVGFLMTITANLCALACTWKAYRIFRREIYSGTSKQILLSFSLAYQLFFLLDSLTGLPHFSYEINTLYLMCCGYGVGVYRLRERKGAPEAAERSRG